MKQIFTNFAEKGEKSPYADAVWWIGRADVGIKSRRNGRRRSGVWQTPATAKKKKPMASEGMILLFYHLNQLGRIAADSILIVLLSLQVVCPIRTPLAV